MNKDLIQHLAESSNTPSNDRFGILNVGLMTCFCAVVGYATYLSHQQKVAARALENLSKELRR